MEGETCITNEYPDTDINPETVQCKFVHVPGCVDRTVHCKTPPFPLQANISFVNQPNTIKNNVMGTKISYKCLDDNFYFDYPLGTNVMSFADSENINEAMVTCSING